jgi:hypothetical protein
MSISGVSIKPASSDFNISASTALSPVQSANRIVNKVEYSPPFGVFFLPGAGKGR